MPDYMNHCAETWSALHPRWVFYFWDESKVESFGLENQHLWDHAVDLSSEPMQFRSDVARYEILHRIGGVWVDMDMECQKPIDDLLDVEAFMGWEVPGRWLNNAIIGSESGTAFLEEVVAKLSESVNKGIRSNTKMSGPQYVTKYALRHRVTTYPKDWFYPYLWNELDRKGEDFPNAYAIHHWNNRRKRL